MIKILKYNVSFAFSVVTCFINGFMCIVLLYNEFKKRLPEATVEEPSPQLKYGETFKHMLAENKRADYIAVAGTGIVAFIVALFDSYSAQDWLVILVVASLFTALYYAVLMALLIPISTLLYCFFVTNLSNVLRSVVGDLRDRISRLLGCIVWLIFSVYTLSYMQNTPKCTYHICVVICLLYLFVYFRITLEMCYTRGRILLFDNARIRIGLFALLFIILCVILSALVLSSDSMGAFHYAEELNLTDKSDLLRTLHSLYFVIVTITTVGYGDIVPANDLGRFVVVIIILSGLFLLTIFASLFINADNAGKPKPHTPRHKRTSRQKVWRRPRP